MLALAKDAKMSVMAVCNGMFIKGMEVVQGLQFCILSTRIGFIETRHRAFSARRGHGDGLDFTGFNLPAIIPYCT